MNLELARHALAKGHRVTLVANRVDSSLLEAGAEWLRVPVRVPRPHLLKVREFARNATRLLAGPRPSFDLLHANGYVLDRDHDVNTAHFVHAASRRREAACRTPEGRLTRAYRAVYARLNASWERRAFAGAERVIAVSPLVGRELVDVGVEPSRIVVVPNGVDLDEFCPGPGDRPSLGLPSGPPLAVFVGAQRSGRKNLTTLLEALTRLRELHLAVVGDLKGSPYPALAARLGLGQRTHFLGARRDVADILRAGDVFVLPSTYEPFGLVLLEAMATGLPVVTTSTVGAAYLAEQAGGLVLGDPTDVDALAGALDGLLGAPAARRDLGARCRAVAEECSWSSAGDRTLAVYREVLAARGRRA